jgi:hypothetical protein
MALERLNADLEFQPREPATVRTSQQVPTRRNAYRSQKEGKMIIFEVRRWEVYIVISKWQQNPRRLRLLIVIVAMATSVWVNVMSYRTLSKVRDGPNFLHC